MIRLIKFNFCKNLNKDVIFFQIGKQLNHLILCRTYIAKETMNDLPVQGHPRLLQHRYLNHQLTREVAQVAPSTLHSAFPSFPATQPHSSGVAICYYWQLLLVLQNCLTEQCGTRVAKQHLSFSPQSIVHFRCRK